MIRNTLHILLAAVMILTPPGASMVEYTCDETGSITQIMSTLGASNHVDACCDDEETASHAVTSVAADCCHATIFSLPPTSQAPTQVVADAAPALTPLDVVRPEHGARMAAFRSTCTVRAPISRNLPLLV